MLRRVGLSGEEGFPLVLEEPQKTLPAGKNVGQRPRLERGVFGQALQQVLHQEVGQAHLAGVQRQQHLQQIDRLLDELRHDAEALHQHEVLGFPLGQLVAVVLLVRLVNGVEVRTVQPGDHRVVQLREQLVQGERRVAVPPSADRRAACSTAARRNAGPPPSRCSGPWSHWLRYCDS